MTRVKGAATYQPVEIHVLSVGWHSVLGGTTSKGSELQTEMFAQSMNALDAFTNPIRSPPRSLQHGQYSLGCGPKVLASISKISQVKGLGWCNRLSPFAGAKSAHPLGG